MPREYNTAVTAFRTSLVLLLIFLGVLIETILYTPPQLTFLETRSYTVTWNHYYAGSGGKYSHSAYWVTFTDDETGSEIKREVTKEQYDRYPEGLQVTLPVYTINGKTFRSIDNSYSEKAASKEYYKLFPTLRMKVNKYALIIIGTLFLFAAAYGAEELIKAGNHVFLPVEIKEPDDSTANAINQPSYDEIFEKTGKL